MGFDPVLLKQLLETFRIELEERLQEMTAGLLQLEKQPLDEIEETKWLSPN